MRRIFFRCNSHHLILIHALTHLCVSLFLAVVFWAGKSVLRNRGGFFLVFLGFLFHFQLLFVFQKEVRHIIGSEALLFIVRFILYYSFLVCEVMMHRCTDKKISRISKGLKELFSTFCVIKSKPEEIQIRIVVEVWQKHF